MKKKITMTEKEILLFLHDFLDEELSVQFYDMENIELEGSDFSLAYKLSRCYDYCNETLKKKYKVYGSGQTFKSPFKENRDN